MKWEDMEVDISKCYKFTSEAVHWNEKWKEDS